MPKIEKKLPGPFDMIVVNRLKDSVTNYRYAIFPDATPLLFARAVLSIDKNRRTDIDVRYTFTFTNIKPIPNGSSLILTVPTYYNFITTTPDIRVSYPNFVDASSTSKLSSFYSANKVVISNIGAIPANSDFQVIIKGVKNPDYGDIMNAWFCEIIYNDFSLIRHDNFYAISLENPGTFSDLALNTITVFPSNADVVSRYSITITPKVKLSLGSEIWVSFPEQYKVLPAVPDCSISGGIKTYTSCLLNLNSIVYRLDADYEVSQGPIDLSIANVLNPDKGTTSSLEVSTKYDGVVLEKTNPAVLTNLKLEISPKPSILL
jgi:hypothetical protein